MAAVESARALAEYLSSNDLGCPADANELELAIEARDKAVALAVLQWLDGSGPGAMNELRRRIESGDFP